MVIDDGHAAAAGALLSGLSSATVLSAMSPCQPDAMLAAILAEGRRTGATLTLLVADLTGRWNFLTTADEADLGTGRLRLVSLAGAVPRRLSGRVEHYPNSLYDIDRYIADGRLAADIFVARVHPADRGSGFSLGDMVGYTPAALGRVERVGFEVRAGRRSFGHSALVERHRPDAVAAAPDEAHAGASGHKPSPQQRRIGRIAAELLPDDATLQLGLGAVPEAVVPYLADKKCLGLHSGIFPASLQPLIAAGVLRGEAKSYGRGLHIATGVLSWQEPAGPSDDDRLRLEPISVTHSPEVLRQQHRLWAINSAFEVDLLGQVNAEYAAGARVASGGGQGDFFRAAHLSDGGAAVLVIPARTTSGRPRIVPLLRLAHHVTSSAADVDYVVTDFGVANLTAATASERARRMIEVAHPGDREALERKLE